MTRAATQDEMADRERDYRKHDDPRSCFNIYNMNTGEELGDYEGSTEDAALDAMARDHGFADYAACISEYGVSVEDAKAELIITRAEGAAQ